MPTLKEKVFIPINRCVGEVYKEGFFRKCPYVRWNVLRINKPNISYCEHMEFRGEEYDNQGNCKRIENPLFIPEWCPLRKTIDFEKVGNILEDAYRYNGKLEEILQKIKEVIYGSSG